MKRRELILLLGSAMVTARPLRAQRKAMPVVGYFHPGSPSSAPASVTGFRQGLSEAGYLEGKNLLIEYRWAEGNYNLLPALAVDLVGHKVDVIAAIGNAAFAAKNATTTIPIVFMGVSDPVAMGLVASLARPGGNVTGFSNQIGELMSKRFELLCELVPQAKLIALLVNPDVPPSEHFIRDVQEGAHAKRVQLSILKAGTADEIDAAFASLVEQHAGALLVWGDAFFANRREQFLALASRHAVPAMYAWLPFVAAGGLIGYGIDNVDVWRRAGVYVGRILKGAKPADLPVQQPTQFELAVNLKTADTLGLTIPPSILARATEVIE